MKSWVMTSQQLCDLEMLLTGAFAPLTSFMSETDYKNVTENMRLENGQFWPLPIVLDVRTDFANSLNLGDSVALYDAEGLLIAILSVQECWVADTHQEKQDNSAQTPYFIQGSCISGELHAIELPNHHDYPHYRRTPAQLHDLFRAKKWKDCMAVQLQKVIHRGQWQAICRYAQTHNMAILLHIATGSSSLEDNRLSMLIRCQEYLLQHYPEQATHINLLNVAPRSTDSIREWLLRALIHRNYGCTHFMVDADQLDLLRQYEVELDIQLVSTPPLATEETALLNFSDAELSQYLHDGLPVPVDFSFPEVLTSLQKAYPPKHRQGFTVFFTGLSGSGKSTMAKTLLAKLITLEERPISLLDGDVVRKHLSSELNFSKEHRDINIRRIGFVASEIVKNGGIAICAPIAPYAHSRLEVRDMIRHRGGFIEVYVSTPLTECERRDRKGLYAKARAGLVKGFTGIDDPYEIPENPEIIIDTSHLGPADCIEQILHRLVKLGYVKNVIM